MSRTRLVVAMGVAAVLVASCTGGSTDGSPKRPDDGGPPAGDRWVVALGDSYISGEGARWAANTNAEPRSVDALGPRAYADNGRAEADPGCHRAKSTEVQVADALMAKTLACSGATVASSSGGGSFKPGLDFFDDGSGHVGQAAALEDFAATHQVSDVVVSIGGNDFGFGAVVAQCAGAFLSTVGERPRPCSKDPSVKTRFSGEQARLVENRILAGLRNVAVAMRRAGYADDQYLLVVQTYPSPIPPGPQLRYRETLLERGLVGGCPFFSADATWANQGALAVINGAVAGAVGRLDLDNARLLDLTDALAGHRLCEKGVGLFDPREFENWRDEGVADSVEWVNRIYTGSRPWQIQESLHPNYWGVAAARAELADLLGKQE